MPSKNKTLLSMLILGLGYFSYSSVAHAFCPICTIAVGGTLVLMEKFGVDNTLSGIWIGAFMLSMIFWTIDWLKEKKFFTPTIGILVYLFYYGSVMIPLWMTNVIGLPGKRIWGLDKVVVGMAFGTVFFCSGIWLAEQIKKRNNNKVYFPFQKIVISLVPLIILTVIFYFATRT